MSGLYTSWYTTSVSGATSPKTPALIYVSAQITEFSGNGEVRATVSTAKNQLNMTVGHSKIDSDGQKERKIKLDCQAN